MAPIMFRRLTFCKTHSIKHSTFCETYNKILILLDKAPVHMDTCFVPPTSVSKTLTGMYGTIHRCPPAVSAIPTKLKL